MPTVSQHYKILGWLFLIFGVLGVLGSLGGIVFMGFMIEFIQQDIMESMPSYAPQTETPGLAPSPTEPTPVPEQPATSPGDIPQATDSQQSRPGQVPPQQFLDIFRIIWMAILALALISSLLSVLAGWGLFARKAWAKVITIIVSVLYIINFAGFPVITGIGIYGLWAMFQTGKPNAWEQYVAGENP
ncbi:MAG TPA: hypothetical protein PLU88_06935 [Armatimonadota bacterium]|nr:hypothetical protein [Armatimonadota bacterium]HOP80306.1 hypothetical protein [Armatimonadota bacterium]HPP74840.1 hypothetical protein [Armatimonadota bacterium]